MGLDLNYYDGQTPIDEDEKEGLLITTITTREELDEFEQQNIEQAVEHYLIRRKFKAETILTERFILDVHKRMFGDVWDWAGKIRKSNKNIGVDKFQIPSLLHQLVENCKYWIENKTFSEEEIAIRFKHEIVSIHVFPNGNGRHSRLMADIIIKHIFKKPIFTWGHKDLQSPSKVRDTYIKALREADKGDFKNLIDFSQK
jgi:Fic-DOC domain mobile mystery protein B